MKKKIYLLLVQVELEKQLRTFPPDSVDIRAYIAEQIRLFTQKLADLDRSGGVSLETAPMQN